MSSLSAQLSEFISASSPEQKPIKYKSAEEAFQELCRLYDHETGRIQDAFAKFKGLDDVEDTDDAKVKGFYPLLRINVEHKQVNLDPTLSHGAFKEEGVYELHVANPRSYNHLLEQMEMLSENAEGLIFEVGLSEEQIPLHYAMRNLNFNLGAEEGLSSDRVNTARRIFHPRNPTDIKDYNSSDEAPAETKLLLPYNGQRVDHAENAFFYYTRTPFQALQQFVIFSNYAQYVEEFYNYGVNNLNSEFNHAADEDKPYPVAVIRTGQKVLFREGVKVDDVMEKIRAATELDTKKGAQMPACHIMMSDGIGVSMINTGVGGPNALNIADTVSVKRSDGWFMAGHAAGLSPTLKVGDYVCADGYFVNSSNVNAQGTGFDYSTVRPVAAPTSSEMQTALSSAVEDLASNMDVPKQQIFRRAGVVSTDYRFWERFEPTKEAMQPTNAAVLDMETSWLALKALEQSIPFSGFLKVSDLPYHDIPKTAAMADTLFDEGLGPHLGIILKAIETLKEDHYNNMHSRKYRPVDNAHVMQ